MLDPNVINAVPDVTSTLVSGLLQFGAFGALVGWLVLKFVPKMQADNEAARADFKAALTDLRTTFIEEMRLERESHAHEMDRLLDQILKRSA